MENFTISSIQDLVGQEIGVTNWIAIDQERINAFADCTGDHQWIHVDVERCAQESPFGKTIAHGYLTLSLLPLLMQEVRFTPNGVKQVLNYGANKVRFLNPVTVDSKIRLRVILAGIEEKGNGRYLLQSNCTMEIEGEEKPAMIAETLSMMFV